MKKYTFKKIELVCLIAILIGIFIIIFLQIKPSQKESFVLNYGEADKQILFKKKIDLQERISGLEYELFYLKEGLSIVEMDLEAIENNMSFKYIKIPNSSRVMRFEYNGSKISDIDSELPYPNIVKEVDR